MKYSEYRDLTPINNVKDGDEYLNALDWALKNPKIKNIALSGPYGAGKSSIIETYLERERQKNHTKCSFKSWYNEFKLSKKYLKISMATFIEGRKENNGENSTIEVDADEVEEGILKQLFYKVDHRKIPQSRYRKLHMINLKNVFIKLSIISLLVIFFSKIFIPQLLDIYWNKIKNFIGPCKFSNVISFILAVVIWMIGICIISYIWKMILSKYFIKEVKLPGETSIQKQEENEKSVFNKNLDEIMYFFESTSYQVIFFEDLDRLKDKKIFVHLRELNNLLNNDDSIKRKPIVFVYAVRDDIFSKEDRTKFFDFIIPIIPVINSTNSGEILLERLKESKLNNIKHNISQEFILDIAPFISDMRVLQNIYNEFVVYKETLRTEQNLSLPDENMMALIIFKNLYPNDFAKIQSESGIIKQAFLDKEAYINSKKQALQECIDSADELIQKESNEMLKSENQIKYAMMVDITNGDGIATVFNDSQYSDRTDGISSKSILSGEYDMSQIFKYKYVHYVDFSRNYGCIEVNNIQDIVTDYLNRWKTLKEFNQQGLNLLQDKIAKIKAQQYGLSSRTLKELIEDYSAKNVLSGDVKKNKFLVFLLRRGYINENYANYINYFKGNSITTDDMNFILSIKNQEPKPFDYLLSKTDMVIHYLQDYEFEQQKAIYNFQLLEQLLKEDMVGNKLKLLIRQLADEDNISWSFIDEFIEKTAYEDKFIQLLSNEWKRIWIYISDKQTLSYERRLKYLVLLLKYLNQDELFNINVDNCLTEYIENHKDILQRLNILENDKIIKFICTLNISFKELEIEGVPDEVLNYVFDNCYYTLNKYMIQNIIQHQNIGFLKNFEKKPYTTIIKLGYDPLIKYVQKNIEQYVETIILKQSDIADDIQEIIDLLHMILDKKEICEELIKKENFQLCKLDECLGAELAETKNKEKIKFIWDSILNENKVLATWENILIYWKNYNITECLKQFITINTDCLEKDNKIFMEDDFIRDFIKADFNDEVIEKLLPLLRMKEFDLDLDSLRQNILEIMVECNYFEFNIQYYDQIMEVNPDIALKFIINNQQQFVSLLDDFKMTSNLLEKLLFDDKIDLKIKRALFDQYAVDYMTEYIAENMNDVGFSVTEKIFEEAKKYLNTNKKEKLMLDNLGLFDNAEKMQEYFEELEGDYYKLADRTRQHIVELKATQENKKLIRHLEEINYITSWECKYRDIYNKETEQDEQIEMMRCRVKKKK